MMLRSTMKNPAITAKAASRIASDSAKIIMGQSDRAADPRDPLRATQSAQQAKNQGGTEHVQEQVDPTVALHGRAVQPVVEGVASQQQGPEHGAAPLARKGVQVGEKIGQILQRANVRIVFDGVEVIEVERIVQGIAIDPNADAGKKQKRFE